MTTTDLRPLDLQARALGPDLARGFMLLFIALANSHYFLQGDAVLGGYPQDGSVLDQLVTWLISTFVDGRSYPLFGLLFGYGVAQIVRRQLAMLSRKRIRRLLWRRSAVLIVVGFLHAVLLFAGDILAAYGVLLLIGAWMVNWKDRWLIVVAVLVFVVVAVPGETYHVDPSPPDLSMLSPDFATQVAERLPVWLVVASLGPIGFLCPYLVGLWAGRRRILERPEQHRTLLISTAVVGIAVAIVGAQPVSLLVSGVLAMPDQSTREIIGRSTMRPGCWVALGMPRRSRCWRPDSSRAGLLRSRRSSRSVSGR